MLCYIMLPAWTDNSSEILLSGSPKSFLDQLALCSFITCIISGDFTFKALVV